MVGRRIGGAGEADGREISLATLAAWLSFITEPILDQPAARRLIGLAERRPATPPQGASSDDGSAGRAAQFGR